MRSAIAIHNERTKLRAATLNALAIGLLALAVLRPIVDDIASLSAKTAAWSLASLALHGAAHYVLGALREGPE